jgi:excisionase family DNA binding protein
MKTVTQTETDTRLQRIETELREIKKMLGHVISSNAKEKIFEKETLMSVKEVAAFTKVNTSVIYNKCAAGEIPFFKVGKLYKFKKEDILRWLESKNEKSVDVDAYVNDYLQKHLMKG